MLWEKKKNLANRNTKEPEKLIHLWRKIKPVSLQTVQEKEMVTIKIFKTNKKKLGCEFRKGFIVL